MDGVRSEDFIIEDVGVQEIDVYDIEVEDNNNFFGNDLLLHNSILMTIDTICDLENKKDPLEMYNDMVKYLKDKVEPVIEEYYTRLKDLTNARDVDILMEREVICRKVLFTAKKKYFWWLFEKDGIVFKDSEKFKDRGLDTRRSSTPVWVSDKLDKFLRYTVKDMSTDKLRNFVFAAKKRFFKLNIDDISKPVSTGKLSDYSENDMSGLLPHYRGAFAYNRFLDMYDKEKRYEKITAGTKVKWCWIYKNKELRTNAIALPEDYNPEIIKHIKINYKEQFESVFQGLVDQVFQALGEKFIKKNKLI